MLVFSAICPHPPILIPGIGKENLSKIEKTKQSMEMLKKGLDQANPDTIIIISPHGEINRHAFSINTNQEYRARFENFGDFKTELHFKSDLEFINTLKGLDEVNMPIHLVSENNLDHGSSVPLYYLNNQNEKARIVPITYSFLGYDKHLQFGRLIKEAASSLNKKYAIIASGDLSHRLTKQAPAGFSPKAKEFDKKLIQLLKKKNTEGILNLDKTMIEEAAECGLRSILILLGAIANMNY